MRELARKMGPSHLRISPLAHARRAPSPLTIRKVADALGVKPGDLPPEP
ncbi:helix-turn-helix domain-containing protein [Enorma burkinafasonensis]